jgi:hypothetical protein
VSLNMHLATGVPGAMPATVPSLSWVVWVFWLLLELIE